MKTAIFAALAATFFLPVAAQNTTPTVQQRTQPATAEKSVTPRENARIAKAQNKDMKCATKEKQPRQKKATAT